MNRKILLFFNGFLFFNFLFACSLRLTGKYHSDAQEEREIPSDNFEADFKIDSLEVAGECGNGIKESGEQCDDGNNIDGDGCDSNCKFSCQIDSECWDDNICDGYEKCDHYKCVEGNPVDNGIVCGTEPRKICINGTCQESYCGDNFIDTGAGEFCDPPGDNCTEDCKIACKNNNDCPSDGNPCNGDEYCDTQNTRLCQRTTPLNDGNVCNEDPRKICLGGSCQDSICGDGFTDSEAGEECDDRNTIPGDGCENNCTFSCHDDSECDDGEICNGQETCNPTTHTCQAGINASSETPCNDGLFCTLTDTCNGSGQCVGSGNPCPSGECLTNIVCHEDTDNCSYEIQPGYCYIGGICFSDGNPNPSNECLSCNSSTSQNSWTPKNNLSPCSSGICCSGNCVSGDCCERFDCPSDYCAGTATPCENFTTRAGCNAQNGCTWIYSGYCTGTYNCSDLTDTCSYCYCNWGGKGGCQGGTKDCSSYDYLHCDGCPCRWHNTSHCERTPTPCSDFHDSSSCTNQSGCNWVQYSCTNYTCQQI